MGFNSAFKGLNKSYKNKAYDDNGVGGGDEDYGCDRDKHTPHYIRNAISV